MSVVLWGARKGDVQYGSPEDRQAREGYLFWPRMAPGEYGLFFKGKVDVLEVDAPGFRYRFVSDEPEPQPKRSPAHPLHPEDPLRSRKLR